MEFQERNEDGIVIVRPVADRVDTVSSDELKRRLLEIVEAGHRTILIDLSNVEFMDSSGLGALISAVKRMQSRGEVLLCGLRPAVRNLLKLTQMQRIFPVFDTVADARASRMGRVG